MPEKNTAISVGLQELRPHTCNKACGSLFSFRGEETLLKSDSSDVGRVGEDAFSSRCLTQFRPQHIQCRFKFCPPLCRKTGPRV